MTTPCRLARRARGFTLIELMIVVAIVGVLAVIAVVGLRKYIANSKTAEARNALGQMGTNALKAFEGETTQTGISLTPGTKIGILRTLCASATTTVPSTAAAIKGKKYQSAPGEWAVDVGTNAGFSCLKFVIDTPQYYMYSYVATAPGTALGNSFTATANGDTNGDGVLSTFTLTGTIGAGDVLNVSPTIGEVKPDE